MKTRKSKRLSQTPLVEEELKHDGDVISKRQRLGKKTTAQLQNTIKCESMEDRTKEVVKETNGSLGERKKDVKKKTNYDSDSSGSSSNEFLQPADVLDFDPDFYKIKKEEPMLDFSSIEKSILSDVKRLSESDSSEFDDEPYSFKDNFKVLSNLKTESLTESENKNSSKEAKIIEEKVSRKESVKKGKRNLKNSKEKSDVKQSSKSKSNNIVSKRNNKDANDVDKMDVTQLLAHGETLRKESTETNISHLSGSDDEVSDLEEVGGTDALCGRENAFPEKGIEVTVKLPDLHQKRKKKQFDMEAYLKRKLNRRIREFQILIHKVHLLCWIAHGRYVNSVLNTEALMGVCLSLIPSQHCYPPDRANLSYLEQIVKWFNKTVYLEKEDLSDKKKSSQPLLLSLLQQMEKKVAESKRDHVLLFICLLRSLGLGARLVISLQPLPLKPRSDELCSLTAKSSKEKKSPKERKPNNVSNEVLNKKRGVMSKEEAVERMKEFKVKTGGVVSNIQSSKATGDKADKVSNQKEEKAIEGKISHPLRTRKKAAVKYKEDSDCSDEDPEVLKKNEASKSCGKNGKVLSAKDNKSDIDKKANTNRSSSNCVAENKTAGKRGSGRVARGVVKTSDDKSVKSVNSCRTKNVTKDDSKKNNTVCAGDHSSDEFTPVASCSSQQKKGKSREKSKVQDDSDFEPEVQTVRKRASGGSNKKVDRSVLSSDSSDGIDGKNASSRKGCDFWTEVYLEAEESWISVDVPRGKVHCIQEIYTRATKPVTYVLAWNTDLTLKDVTRRYCPQFHTTTRKQRVDPEWWDETLKPFVVRRPTARDREEEEEMDRQLQDRPLPKTLAEYKNHPLYVLPQHLLKFEAIYPPDAPPLGYFRQEPVYARECVHTLHSREVWVKEAKVVRPGETPYKIVKARPKYDRMTGKFLSNLPLEVFGYWQVDDYVPPEAVDGKVPRNPYGNVELFKPCMLPKGTVHMQLSGLNRVARKLQIDCAPAMIGFDYHSGGSHPVYDGYVVCEEFKEILTDAWAKEQAEAVRREQERIDKRVYGNWRRLIKGLMIRERLKARYSFDEPSGSQQKRSKKGKVSSKKRKVESDDDSEWENIE